MPQDPCALPVEKILAQFGSDSEHGLEKEEARKRLEKYGLNQIPEQGTKSRWRILADQLFDPIIYILAVAAVLAFFFSDLLEGFAIIVVILISVGIGFFMELQAIRSLEALRKMGQAMIYVIRSGKRIKIKAAEVVPGDIVLIQTGDVIPADARLMTVDVLSVKESALTGESIPVTKKTEVLKEKTSITERTNMVFRGTMAVTGSGKAVVIATGKNTELGKIQQMGVDAHKERTPLEKKLNQLSKWLIWLTLFFAVLIVVTGYIRGKDLLLMIETGVALAVAAIPEGLPIVATIALAQGMLRLSKKDVIIKKLEAVQTLGATDIICTDKTGTLTEDQMKVHTVVLGTESLSGVFPTKSDVLNSESKYAAFEKMIMASILCNNVAADDEDGQGDSIELALIHFANRLGYDTASIKNEHREKFELPFDAERKLMATVNRNKASFEVFVKGAFESVMPHCDSYWDASGRKPFDQKEAWNKKLDGLASQGLRTLAFAFKEVQEIPKKNYLLKNLTFLGIIGFIDPARADVKPVMDIYKKAGIRVVMVTGDHPGTSRKIAEEVGLLEPDSSNEKVQLGRNLQNSSDDNGNLSIELGKASVFARVTPEQKLNLVSMYQKNGHIVGMIGDGINDVPALKKADIGIAMGIRGTEAAREVADVILKNDKFTAIELGIRQGRVVFQNIRQFVVYLLSCNLAEILSVGLAALFNLPAPLLPLQILFLNLVTDVFPALALGLGKGEADIMEQPPKNPNEPIMSRQDWSATAVYGLCISAAVLGVVAYGNFVLELSANTINNMAFYTLVMAQLFNVFNMPKRQESFVKNEVTQNVWVWGAIVLSLLITIAAYLIPPVADALSLQALSFELVVTVVGFGLGSLVLAQLLKRVA
ncbi:cation-translocating P-type ATPase [Maribacter sp. ACAM166]|uniref:cation-translocating P-type ATPase n=1 Tax=Maribacter sp. ACAM166 TaxID=2508996 RepID=UPI0010FD600B|nr:cation-transporting P-type ATPase [Maribacter sp. ACAM166]TLP81724.1 cation-transporting P-type ATPase [Maribacter sp. ACAM166]